MVRAESKNHVVYFRLSPAEYEAIRVAYEESGSKDLSSFLRAAVLEHLLRLYQRTDDIAALNAKFVDFEQAFQVFIKKRRDKDSTGRVSQEEQKQNDS